MVAGIVVEIEVATLLRPFLINDSGWHVVLVNFVVSLTESLTAPLYLREEHRAHENAPPLKKTTNSPPKQEGVQKRKTKTFFLHCQKPT